VQVDSGDRVRVEDDQTKEIQSFHDSATIREVLSLDDQESLSGSESQAGTSRETR
jgi:hypothetical protein